MIGFVYEKVYGKIGNLDIVKELLRRRMQVKNEFNRRNKVFS
jgi:hypothetical protein